VDLAADHRAELVEIDATNPEQVVLLANSTP